MQNEERIIGLETQVRTLKRIVYGFGCLLVTGIVVGATSLQTVPDVIQAKKFEVVNDEGKTVAVLGTNAFGGWLDISNNDKTEVVSFGASECGSAFGLANKDGISVIGFGADANGGHSNFLDKIE